MIALVLLITAACSRGDEAADEKSAATSDETSVTMAAKTAEQNGIEVVTLQPVSADTAIPIGNATVVDVTDLLNAASQYAAATSQRAQAAAKVQASRAELQRLRVLNADNKNVSDRAVQEAAANAATDEATVSAATVSALAAEAAARQRWGAVLANGVLRNAAWAQRLASRDAVLVEAAFTSITAPPAQVSLSGASGRNVTARYLAASPRVDARLQKAAHEYIADAADLPVGLVTTIYGPGAAGGGVLVPKIAVLWNGDQAIVFLEEKPGHYVQHPVSASRPVPAGFIETTLQAGQRVVTTGAQQLLSEQNKPVAE